MSLTERTVSAATASHPPATILRFGGSSPTRKSDLQLSTHSSPSSQSLIARIPFDSWDSHMHVVDPEQYPLSPTAAYVPHPHRLPEAIAFESSIGFRNVVLVQPSIYGNDNSCLLAALQELGAIRARGVVALDPKTTDEVTLRRWHKMGVRGVRVNLKSVGRKVVEEELKAELLQYASLIRPLGWVLELFIGMEYVLFLEMLIPQLKVKVCLAHFGAPTFPESFTSASESELISPYSLPGFQSLMRLLERGDVYVKLSAAYRFSTQKEFRDLEPLAQEMLRVAGRSRLVFATDWPHTRFTGLDIKPVFQSSATFDNMEKTPMVTKGVAGGIAGICETLVTKKIIPPDPTTGGKSPLVSVLAGLSAGAAESIIVVTPGEVLKTRLVQDAGESGRLSQKGLISAATAIVKEGGAKALWKGLGPVLCKQGTNSAVRFTTFDLLQQYVARKWPNKERQVMSTLGLGAISGVVTVLVIFSGLLYEEFADVWVSYASMPFDNIKTRMQSTSHSYEGMCDCAIQTLRQDGVAAFWRGTSPRLVRLTLSSGITFAVYNQVIKLFEAQKPQSLRVKAEIR
ncbi:hypothetical protein B7463_g6804, partial [Scytalidium lignicola]